MKYGVKVTKNSRQKLGLNFKKKNTTPFLYLRREVKLSTKKKKNKICNKKN